MLTQFRKIADSFWSKILLALITISFVGWGAKEASRGFSSQDVVSFSKAENITLSEFLEERNNTLKRQEQLWGQNFNEEEIKDMQLDNVVLQKMIRNNIMDYIAQYYNFDITDDMVIKTVKQSKVFKNGDDDFNIDIFKAHYPSDYLQEKYFDTVKSTMLNKTIIDVFTSAFPMPPTLKNILSDYVYETRDVSIISYDLINSDIKINQSTPSDTEIENFYNEHIDLFTIPEKRTYQMLKIPYKKLLEKINITNDEMINFYKENQETFGNNSFEQVKQEVERQITAQKLEPNVAELVKNLEENVASGMNLQEISKKYNSSIMEEKEKSYDSINSPKDAADLIFEMTEQEVAYPIDDKEHKEIVVFSLNKIIPQMVEELSNSKEKAIKLLNNDINIANNLKNFTEFASSYDIQSKIPNQYNIDNNVRLYRNDDVNHKTIPSQLIRAIFLTKINNSTPVIRIADKVYFAHVNKIFREENKDNKFAEESINNSLKNIVIEELIHYFIKDNNTKINNNLLPRYES